MPNLFGTIVIRNVITGSVFSELAQHLNWVEAFDESVYMNTTPIESDSPLWYLDLIHNEIPNVCSAVADKYLEFELRNYVRDVFRIFCAQGKGTVYCIVSHV